MATSIHLDVVQAQNKKKSYNDHFPAAEMNVKFVTEAQRVTANGKRIVRRGVALTKSMAAGETVFVEDPMVAALDLSACAPASCAQCFKSLDNNDGADAIECENCSASTYCSLNCRDLAKTEHTFMCIAGVATGNDATALAGLAQAEEDVACLLAAKFLVKFAEKESKDDQPEKYSDWDHIERMHDLKPDISDKERLEASLIKKIISPGVPGFGRFLTDDRYMLVKSKMMYNAIAVPTDGQVDAVRSEIILSESHNASPIKGHALFHIVSTISHSCEPNVALRFDSSDTNRVSVVALKDLDKDDELFVSYLPSDMPFAKRKSAIRSHFGFVCKCKRCETKN